MVGSFNCTTLPILSQNMSLEEEKIHNVKNLDTSKISNKGKFMNYIEFHRFYIDIHFRCQTSFLPNSCFSTTKFLQVSLKYYIFSFILLFDD